MKRQIVLPITIVNQPSSVHQNPITVRQHLRLFRATLPSILQISQPSTNRSTTMTILIRSQRTKSILPPIRFLYVRRHRYLARGRIRGRLHQLRLAWFPILDQQRYSDPSGRTTASARLSRRSLRLVPVILEPDLHLGGGQPYNRGQMLPLGGAQVFLLAETSLELERLRLGEQHSPLPLFVLRLVGLDLVRLLLVLELGRLFLFALVVRLLLRWERQIRDGRAGRVWLLQHWNFSSFMML